MANPVLATSADCSRRDGRRPGVAIAFAVSIALVLLVLEACGGTTSTATRTTAVREGAGVTLVGSSASYIVLFNVVDPEQMYTPTQAARRHPSEGELLLGGTMAPIVRGSRHTEFHLYDKTTGRTLAEPAPHISLVDETSGTSTLLEPALMQDVVIGPSDLHFGNNTVIPLGHRFRAVVELAGERIVFGGTLL